MQAENYAISNLQERIDFGPYLFFGDNKISNNNLTNKTMELREHLSTKERFEERITFDKEAIEEEFQDLKKLLEAEEKGIQLYTNTNKEVIEGTKANIITYSFDLITTKYSAGYPISEIKKDYDTLLSVMSELWEEKTLEEFTYAGGKEPYYGTDEYWKVLTLISLGILFEVDEHSFAKIIKIKDKVPTPDILLDFLLSSRDHREIPDVIATGNKYKELSAFLKSEDKDIKNFKKYITKFWYREYKKMGWGDTHNSEFNIHAGYWGFELGAVSKILGLDDSTLQEQKYYPYDMVHWED